jgi:hypothetical protein
VRDTTVARSYAEALFELGERHGAHDDYAQGLDTMSAVLESDPRIRGFLDTPKLSVEHKRDALRLRWRAGVAAVPELRAGRPAQAAPAAAARDRRSLPLLLDEKLGRLHVDVSWRTSPTMRNSSGDRRPAHAHLRADGHPDVQRRRVAPGWYHGAGG